MASAGTLTVMLGLNSAKFQNGLSKAASSLSSFGKSALASIGATVSLGAAVYGISSRISGLAAVADRATQTGLSGKFLQQLEFAADQAGVSAETLTGGIKKLTVALGKAGDGNKSAIDGFESIGLKISDLEKLSPDDRFLAVANAISAIKDPAERAAAAVGVFGKSGIEMTGLFANGMDDLVNQLKQAERLGIGMSDNDLAKAAAADDAIQAIKMSLGALMDRGAVAFAPMITGAANFILRLGDIGGAFDFVIQTGVGWFNNISGVFQDVGVVVGVLIADMNQLWHGLFEDIPKYAMAAFEWISQNSQVIFSNIATSATNMWASIEHKSKELGEWFAFQTGMSDEIIAIPKPQMKPLQGVGDFKAPALSDSTTGVIGDVEAELKLAREQRRKMEAESNLLNRPGLSKLDSTDSSSESSSKKSRDQNRIAGALMRGSTEAYSAIVQSMLRRGKDPVVKATEEQTKQLIIGLAPKKNQILLAMEPVQ